MSSSLRPQFYITRPNGDFVALIAIDELPSNISIRGIPRTLTHHDTQGIVHSGFVEARNQCYAIDGPMSQVFGDGQREPFLTHNSHRMFGSVFGLPSNTQPVASPIGYPVFQANDKPNFASIPRLSQPIAAASGYTSTQISTPPSSPHMTPQTQMTISPAPRSLPPLTLALTKAEPQTLRKAEPQALARAIPGKKEYCSYWLRHGECDYQQQGCLYKHEMPTDMATLHRLGLREIPRWYRETHNLSANTPTSNAVDGLAQSHWAPGQIDSSSGIANRRDNWRFSSNRPTGARQSSPLVHAKTLSFSPPKKHFTLPAPPSPPGTRPASPGSPTRGSASGFATAPSSSPAQTGRLGTRLSQIRDHHLAARNKNSEASSANKASTSALRVDRARGKRPDLVPIDRVPNYPALKPAKRAQLVVQEVKHEDQENEEMEDMME